MLMMRPRFSSSLGAWQRSTSGSKTESAHRLAVGAREPGHFPKPSTLQPQHLPDFDHRNLPVAHSANTAAEQPEAPKPRRVVP